MMRMEAVGGSSRQRRIRFLARSLKWGVSICVLGLVIIALVSVLSILVPSFAAQIGQAAVSIDETERLLADMPVGMRAALATLVLVTLTLVSGALWSLRNLCQQFQKMDFFSPKTSEAIVVLGIWLISYAVFDVASEPVTWLILGLDFAGGERIIDVAVDGEEIFCMILGALLLLFGWIMREAALLAEENRQII
ncbi:DUF2975 domain-containing protein [uncultured Roseibium sp.]|uniref:DUF2975 domain-containing protein n=1 Tax=uncultured Roseibium sp. TaxID=1936171 RepID=UPI00260F31EF|nr:DUF2975 domain-containing protein [uncultured Roseibium sp.]